MGRCLRCVQLVLLVAAACVGSVLGATTATANGCYACQYKALHYPFATCGPYVVVNRESLCGCLQISEEAICAMRGMVLATDCVRSVEFSRQFRLCDGTGWRATEDTCTVSKLPTAAVTGGTRVYTGHGGGDPYCQTDGSQRPCGAQDDAGLVCKELSCENGEAALFSWDDADSIDDNTGTPDTEFRGFTLTNAAIIAAPVLAAVSTDGGFGMPGALTALLTAYNLLVAGTIASGAISAAAGSISRTRPFTPYAAFVSVINPHSTEESCVYLQGVMPADDETAVFGVCLPAESNCPVYVRFPKCFANIIELKFWASNGAESPSDPASLIASIDNLSACVFDNVCTEE